MRIVLCVAVLGALAAPARADRPIRLGATGDGVDRAGVQAALDAAFRAMPPCFRRANGTIVVKLAVGADGEVTSAAATTKGAAGQCIAGLLAVTKFPAGAWKAAVEVDAVSPEQWLADQLAVHQGELAACQAKEPAGRGEVVLALTISKAGAVTGASVEKAAAGKAIAECAKTAARAIELGALPGGVDIKYRMTVTYAGGGGSGATADAGAGTAASGGTVKGALGGDAVRTAWERGRGKVLACGAALTKPAGLTAAFAIRADGSVKNVTLADSTVDKRVEECVDKELRAVTFPTASGETRVHLPIAWK